MENDYSMFRNISIYNDLPIKFADYYFGNINDYFQSLSINTLEDLFIAYDEGLFHDGRKRFNNSIKGKVEILKAYYLSTPLIADDILEQKFSIETYEDVETFFTEYRRELIRVGIPVEELSRLEDYCFKNIGEKKPVDILQTMERYIRSVDNHMSSSDKFNTKALDLIENIRFEANFFRNYLNEKKRITTLLNNESNISNSTEIDLIKNLKSQMEFLLKTRKFLDARIDAVEKHLTTITNSRKIKK